MANIEIHDERPREHRPFQFSIRAMLILTAVVAAACSFVFGLPDSAAPWTVSCVFLLVPGPLTCLAVFGTSRQRAFAIGTLVPWGLFWFVLVLEGFRMFAVESGGHAFLLFGWLACFASGYLSVLTHRWITKSACPAGTRDSSPNHTPASSRLGD